jgi:NitT/TauT family transport system permease protein
VSSGALAPTRPAGSPPAIADRRGPFVSRRFLLLLVVLAAFFGIWEGGVHFTGTLEIILPKPSSIFRALVYGFTQPFDSRASYYFHAQQSLSQIFAGYAVGCTLGLLLAMVSVRFAVIEYVLRPFIVSLQSMPKIALAPVLIVWFGLGFNSKFILVILATFFPLFVNGVTGFKSVEEGPLLMMRSFGASPRQIFTKLTLPNGLPFIFAGLEIAMVHAITSGIAAEFLGGQRGLGTMMLISQQIIDIPGMFSVLVILAFIGWLMSVLLGYLRRRIVYWAPERVRAGAKA